MVKKMEREIKFSTKGILNKKYVLDLYDYPRELIIEKIIQTSDDVFEIYVKEPSTRTRYRIDVITAAKFHEEPTAEQVLEAPWLHSDMEKIGHY